MKELGGEASDSGIAEAQRIDEREALCEGLVAAGEPGERGVVSFLGRAFAFQDKCLVFRSGLRYGLSMDLSRPYSAVAPQVGGDVLTVLAGTTAAMTGRHIARAVHRGSVSSVNKALEQLVAQGLVHRTEAPPAHLYSLNRDHVAYPAVAALANIRSEFLARLRGAFEAWNIPPVHASLFGSAARGDGDIDSDIDVFLVRSREVDGEDETWQLQTDALSSAIEVWTGNPATIIEFSDERVSKMARDTLAPMLDDGVLLHGVGLTELVDRARAA